MDCAVRITLFEAAVILLVSHKRRFFVVPHHLTKSSNRLILSRQRIVQSWLKTCANFEDKLLT